MLILYHSQGGKTERLAQTCFNALDAGSEIEPYLKRAFDTSIEDIRAADAVLIVTPEYFGTMCGAVKDFFDRTYYPARDLCLSLPYALIICCENEGQGSERDIQKIAQGYVLRKSLDTLIVKERYLEEKLPEVEEFALTFAAGLELGIF
jgi:multimeric flavodoxin WrbA